MATISIIFLRVNWPNFARLNSKDKWRQSQKYLGRQCIPCLWLNPPMNKTKEVLFADLYNFIIVISPNILNRTGARSRGQTSRKNGRPTISVSDSLTMCWNVGTGRGVESGRDLRSGLSFCPFPESVWLLEIKTVHLVLYALSMASKAISITVTVQFSSV